MGPKHESHCAPRRLLHVGCGHADSRKVPEHWFPAATWQEIRLDIDPAVAPDVVASISDMTAVATGSVDAVWSAHNIEHLYAHEVPLALAEFRRVLTPGGFVLLTVPDLQQVAELVAQDRLTDSAYLSPAGPITPFDMLYGLRAAIAHGNHFMGHRGGFTARTLQAVLYEAGFPTVRVVRDQHFALWAAAYLATPPAMAA